MFRELGIISVRIYRGYMGLMVKNMCFLLRRLTLAVKSLHGGGPLSWKQGGLIHQFGVWLGCDIIIILTLYIKEKFKVKRNGHIAFKRNISIWTINKILQCPL